MCFAVVVAMAITTIVIDRDIGVGIGKGIGIGCANVIFRVVSFLLLVLLWLFAICL